LLHREGEIYWTDITQEDLEAVNKERKAARLRKKQGSSPELPESSPDQNKRAEQSRLEQNRAEQSRGKQVFSEENLGAAALSSPSALRALLALEPSFRFDYRNGVVEQLYKRLMQKDAAHSDFLRFCISKMRASPKPIANPSGYLKTAILEYDDWIDEWRKQVRCPDCGMTDGYHIESCPQFQARAPTPEDFKDDVQF